MTKPQISNEEFVRSYMACTSMRQLAELLGTTYNNACYRSKRLRANGVHLPKYPVDRGIKQVDIDTLNSIIDEFNGV